MIKEKFGIRLKRRRKELGIGQRSLAKNIGADQPMISRWEQSKLFPSEPYQIKLMKVLKVDESFFERNSNEDEPDMDAPNEAWPAIINRLAAAEVEIQRLKDRPPAPAPNPDLQKIWRLWRDADPAIQSACLYLLGSDEDLQKVDKLIREEVRLLRSHRPSARPKPSRG